MMQLANQLTLHTDPDRETYMTDLITTPNPSTDSKGKRKMGLIPFPIITSTSSSPKRLKFFKDPFLQIVDYPTPTMENATGKEIDNEKTLMQHYSSLKLQANEERDDIEEEIRSTQPSQLISDLDRKSQVMKIVVIQPAIVGEAQKKKITEFKLNMNQFSVVDKVDFFKQTSELICSNLIITSISKDNLARDFKKLEGKIKTK